MKSETTRKEELIKISEMSSYWVKAMILGFLVMLLVFKFFLGASLSFHPFVVLIIWFFSGFLFLHITKKAETITGVRNALFYWVVLELLLLTITIHYVGGVLWFGPFFYMFIFVYATFLFDKKRRKTMSLFVIFCYLCLFSLEYFGIIPYHEIFPGFNFFGNPQYVLSALGMELGIFIFCFFALGVFHEEQERRIEQLSGAYKKLQEMKNILARRTKTLQERVGELKKFHEIAVGRELKMIELKKEIEKLKKEKGKTK